jgi:muramoyltetrapeptide carboxypeptidase
VRIKVLGGSSPFPPARLEAGRALLAGSDVAAGVVVDVADALPDSAHAYLNGDDATRARLINEALHSDVDVLWFARGGYGITRILHRLEVPARIPVVVGFSDVTALFALLHKRGLAPRCVHAPLVTSLPNESAVDAARVVATVAATVAGDVVDHGADLVPLRPADAQRERAVATGPLFVANLCVLAALCGTRHQPDLRGHVVALEETGERPYRIDRMLTQLVHAGVFDGVTGVVVGHLTGCEEPTANANPARPPPKAADVFIDVLGHLGLPMARGLRCGHEAPNHAFVQGAQTQLVVDVDAAHVSLGAARRVA